MGDDRNCLVCFTVCGGVNGGVCCLVAEQEFPCTCSAWGGVGSMCNTVEDSGRNPGEGGVHGVGMYCTGRNMAWSSSSAEFCIRTLVLGIGDEPGVGMADGKVPSDVLERLVGTSACDEHCKFTERTVEDDCLFCSCDFNQLSRHFFDSEFSLACDGCCSQFIGVSKRSFRWGDLTSERASDETIDGSLSC